MQITYDPYQNAKNKKRLINQNLKLYSQVTQIRDHLLKQQASQDQMNDIQTENPQIKSIIQEIALQQKLIRKLKSQIEHYKLQRAKDNVQYIIHQQDDLKIAKKLELQLIDQKQILLNKKVDKNQHLQKDTPYQTYQQKFLENLNEIVHHNRLQASKITQIEREIRKYHLIKKAKDIPIEQPPSPQILINLVTQIQEKVNGKNILQKQWKPHFSQLDEQYAALVHQVALKKQEIFQLQREQKTWDIRLSGIREVDSVISDKQRLQKVVVNPKLRQKIADYIQSQEDKKKKKVNQQQLKYQFITKKKEQKPPEEVKTIAPPPLPGIKKKQQKIYQTTHNDKNITKKIDKNVIKKIKIDQNINTDVTVPSQSPLSKKKRKQSPSPAIERNISANEQRTQRLWQQTSTPQIIVPRDQKPPSKVVEDNGLIHLKEIGIETSPKLWIDETQQRPQQ